MLRRWLALMPIFLCTLSGCLLTEQTERTSFMKRLQNKTITADHALIEVALIERPIGDDYLNETIWERTDEILADSERRAALEANGLRVGQLVGTLPGSFQQLLLSKRCCSNPHAVIFPAGQARPIYLGSVLPHSEFDVVQGKARRELAVDQARYAFDVTAKFTKLGHTTLTFTPKVENGERLLPFQPVPERSAWELRVEKASKSFPELSWEVTLAPNQFVIVGGRLDHERTLGATAFTDVVQNASVQRLLVVRNCRSVTGVEAHQNNVEDLVRADQSAPLALQATVPISRAKVQ